MTPSETERSTDLAAEVQRVVADPEVQARLLIHATVLVRQFRGVCDPNDVVQEAILRALRKKSEFVGNVTGIEPWVRQIAVFVAKEEVRRVMKAPANLTLFDELPDDLPEPTDDQVLRYLEQLPARQQSIVRLRLERVSHAEIAKQLGISEGNSRLSYTRAKKVLLAMVLREDRS